MKKHLAFVTLALLFACKKPEKKVDEDKTLHQKTATLVQAIKATEITKGIAANSSLIGIQAFVPSSNNIILTGPTGSCVQNTDTSIYKIFATHGYVKYSTSAPHVIDFYVKNNVDILGSGVAVRYPFKQGTNI